MYELPKLNYSFAALEPNIDAATMEIHYSKHHQTYCNNFNALMEKYPDLAVLSAEEIIKNINSLAIEDDDKKKIKNQGGGCVNHNLFWQIMDPSNVRDEKLVSEITAEFGSMEKFKELFTQSATTHFGSGWTWLVRDENKIGRTHV